MTTSSGLWSALIASVTALIVFVLTQLLAGRRERRSTAAKHRHDALVAAQDAALELRGRLSNYGLRVRRSGVRLDDELANAQRDLEDAIAHLSVLLTRVDRADVIAAVEQWRELAQVHFVSAKDVTTAEELAAWRAMNELVGTALTVDRAR
jgi:hypothetical protein